MPIFILKLIAVFFMVVDHVKYAIPSCANEFTMYLGRISFPLFAFCTVQGYIHTSDLKKYVKRLLIVGVITEVPYLLFMLIPTIDVVNLNIMFTLAFGVCALKAYDFYGRRFHGLLAVLIIGFFAQLAQVDYGFFGIMLMYSFYAFDSKFKTLIGSLIVVSGKYLYRILILQVGFKEYPIKSWICTSIPLFIILMYNGKKGPGMKWFFYIFYPLHFLVLWLLSQYAVNLLNL